LLPQWSEDNDAIFGGVVRPTGARRGARITSDDVIAFNQKLKLTPENLHATERDMRASQRGAVLAGNWSSKLSRLLGLLMKPALACE